MTGSTAGIGFAIARGLAGADVVVSGRRQAVVDKVVAAINAGLPAPRATGLAREGMGAA